MLPVLSSFLRSFPPRGAGRVGVSQKGVVVPAMLVLYQRCFCRTFD